MRKKISLILAITLLANIVRADHITGGEMYYTLTSSSGGNYTYNVTVKLFKWCESSRQLLNPNIISVFSKSTGNRIIDMTVPIFVEETLTLNNTNKCITDPPRVCYNVASYNFNVTVPASADGYIISCQVVYRISDITNFTSNNNNIGATYIGEIPGTGSGSDAPQNNSARFTGNDLVVVCAGNSFSYSFAAVDSDNDELQYSFCNAYQGGTGGFNSGPVPPQPPPYESVPYGGTFSGTSPLGANVKIDSRTGLITGIAPATGIYVVTVCVSEIRNGKVIAVQRKDLQLNITSCTIASASLEPEIMLCKESKSLSINNLSQSPLINTYNWDFVNKEGQTLYSTSNATATYTFADTGIYKIRLAINRGQECSDSTESIAYVYPGFRPAFDINGICFGQPSQFVDRTTTVYGSVDSRTWFLDDAMNNITTTRDATISYTYTQMGTKNVNLVVTNTNGCRDTVSKRVNILDKPPVQLAFRDTLICLNDRLRLRAVGNGIYNWSPGTRIDNPDTPNPLVYPLGTTTYYVDMIDGGCTNRDSVLVRVTEKVELEMMNDTTICENDPVQIRIRSNGLQYSWTPNEQVSNPSQAEPLAITGSSTEYRVTAKVGGCSTSGSFTIKTAPFPIANAGADTLICFDSPAFLKGSHNGASFFWSENVPGADRTRNNVRVIPSSTSTYVLTSYDTKGCPKPGRDSCIVTVLPEIIANAGRDTAIVVGQSLQLNASGGIRYEWTPVTWLNATNIPNPIASMNTSSNGISYKVKVFNEAGCVDSAGLMVKVFGTNPQVFVPNAFTPNGDGKNDRLNFIAAGIRTVESFVVFNRWGQRVYNTTNNTSGWDGTISGRLQSPGTYVWIVKAVDFNGKGYIQRGTVTLIR